MIASKFSSAGHQAHRIDQSDQFVILARSAPVGFDDIDIGWNGHAEIPNGYAGLDCSNFFAVHATVHDPGDPHAGYHTGIIPTWPGLASVFSSSGHAEVDGAELPHP